MAQRRTGFVRIDISGICVFQSALVLQQGRGDFGEGFVLLQQLGGFFQVFLEMRAVAVALPGGVIVVDFKEVPFVRLLFVGGGVIGVDFDHVRHLRVGFLFDGIHGEGSRLVCERGADVFVANVVVGGALAVFYAEFKDVEDGRGVGAGGGEGGHEDGGFFHGLSVGFVMGAGQAVCGEQRVCRQ